MPASVAWKATGEFDDCLDRQNHDVGPVIRLAVEHLRHGVLIIGGTGEVLAANRVAEMLFGYGAAEMLGQPIERLLADAAPDIFGLWLRAPSQPVSVHPMAAHAVEGVRRDGAAVHLEVRLATTGDGPLRRIVVTVVDATPPAAGEAAAAEAASLASRRAIADLALGFVNVDPDAIDEALIDGLRQVAAVLQLDYAAVWRRDASDTTLASSHAWRESSKIAAWAEVPEPFAGLLESVLRDGEPVWIPDGSCGGEAPAAACGLEAIGVVPLSAPSPSAVLDDVLVLGRAGARAWPAAEVEQLTLVAGIFGQALARQASVKAMREAQDATHRADTWQAVPDAEGTRHDETAVPVPAHMLSFRRDIELPPADCTIVGQSAAIARVLQQVRQVATTDSTVLLLGETGTGKELLAALVHELSSRRSREMVCVNCSSIPRTLIESELFGRERGAFTGAIARQIGRFELADRSTIFLDEIGEMPPDVQVKLLRVIEARQIERLGNPQSVPVDVRIVAATHRSLEQGVVEGRFREDLFYRLNVFPIRVPPLRERADDIPLLVWRFVDQFSRTLRKSIEAIPRAHLTALQRYSWPGNIRQLRNVVERAMIVATGPVLTIDVPTSAPGADVRSVRMDDVEKEHICRMLEITGWRIRGTLGAADRLGLPPTTLETRMAKLGICRPPRPESFA